MGGSMGEERNAYKIISYDVLLTSYDIIALVLLNIKLHFLDITSMLHAVGFF
jgi:hypothetical protein